MAFISGEQNENFGRRMPPAGSSIYFIGIGGISMSSLAMISRGLGYRVAGSDCSRSALVEKLEKSGIKVNHSHEKKNIDGYETVVYSAAITEDNPELEAARAAGLACIVRADYLGRLMTSREIRIGVAGTHGKSTTTSMLSEIYLAAGDDPTIVSGAELSSIGGAYRVGRKGTRSSFLFEACEYTDSFLNFYPTTAVVLNLDLDHTDYFHSMEQLIDSFTRYMSLADIAVINYDHLNVRKALAHVTKDIRRVACAAEPGPAPEGCHCLYAPADITFENGCGRFMLTRNGESLIAVRLAVPGAHNVTNAVCAAASAMENGISAEAVAQGLAAFGGAKRRMEYKGELHGARVYDDYAHHPAEIRATLAALRQIAGAHRLRCVFQPHSYSRTVEFFDEIAAAFDTADEVIFTDIYINLESEHGIHGITSADLARKAGSHAKYMSSFEETAAYLTESAQPGELIAIIGAGNIVNLFNMLDLQ